RHARSFLARAGSSFLHSGRAARIPLYETQSAPVAAAPVRLRVMPALPFVRLGFLLAFYGGEEGCKAAEGCHQQGKSEDRQARALHALPPYRIQVHHRSAHPFLSDSLIIRRGQAGAHEAFGLTIKRQSPDFCRTVAPGLAKVSGFCIDYPGSGSRLALKG